MRIIGTIEHASYKVTVFKMDNRLSVKLESGLYEQTYKFRDGEGIDSVGQVEQWLEAVGLAHFDQQFQQMHQLRFKGIQAFLKERQDEFDEII